MDYKELLKKYAQHVLDSEGTTFISNNYLSLNYFSEEEITELKQINKELK